MELRYGKLFRYKSLSTSIIILILFDLLCNTVFLLFSHHTLITLVVYIMQNVASVFCFILVAFGIFSTSSAQTGFVGDVLLRFRAVIMAAMCYLTLSLAFHWISLDKQWGAPDKYIWNDTMVTVFTFQRLAAVLYYYLMKRTILRLSDGEFYTHKTEKEEETEDVEEPS